MKNVKLDILIALSDFFCLFMQPYILIEKWGSWFMLVTFGIYGVLTVATIKGCINVCVIIVTIIIFLVVAGVRLQYRINMSKPKVNIIFDKPISGKILTQKQRQAGHDTRMGNPYFASIKIKNQPMSGCVGEILHNAVCKMEAYNEQGEQIPSPELARWSENAGRYNRGEDLSQLIRIDIYPNGETHIADIALKYEDEEECYLFNFNSIQQFNWKDPEWELKPGHYNIKMVICGTNYSAGNWYKLTNEGKGRGLKIEEKT